MADFDSPWKLALTQFFRDFLALFFPRAHGDIDWSRPPETLDKELQQLAPRAASGKGSVDHLVKVWRTSGREAWVLVHVEVQTQRQRAFARRMARYNSRIHDRYARPVASFAVLADDSPSWRPGEDVRELWDFRAHTTFPFVKLWDYRAREAELQASRNLFAPVVLAHLKALETRHDPEARRGWKFELVRGLLRRGLSKDHVRELFKLIDWLLELPRVQDEVFWEEVEQLQEAQRMPFITTPERIGIRRGILQSMEKYLRKQFGEQGASLMPVLQRVYEPDKLDALLDALYDGLPLDELRRRAEAAAEPAPRPGKKPRRSKKT